MIELTFKGSTLEEVFGAMRQALGGTDNEGAKVGVDAIKGGKSLRDRLHEAMFEDDAEDDDGNASGITLDEIKTLAKAKMEEKKSKAIKELLGEFGVAKVAGLAEEDYVAFYEKLEEL